MIIDTDTCAKCKPDYSLNGGTVCASANDDANHHSSNNKICPNYYYYDVDQNRCLKHPDLNCQEASSSMTCTVCKTGFALSPFYSKLIITHKAGERDGCPS